MITTNGTPILNPLDGLIHIRPSEFESESESESETGIKMGIVEKV